MTDPATSVGPDDVLLEGRVALVTGAAQGIGEATALALARFGADVVLVDRLESVERTAAAIDALGRRSEFVVGDVRDDEVVARTVTRAVDELGRIDVLVNNAGGGFWAPVLDVSPKGEAALIAENFTQVTSCIRTAVPHMPDGGAIVNVTSVEAHRAGPGFGVYSAMKAAVASLTKTLALELAPRGIRVNAVAPDMIPTPGDAGLAADSGALLDDEYAPSPLGGMGTPDDAAAAIVFLSGSMSRFVTGATLHLDGGTFAASGWRRHRATDAWSL